MAETKVLIVDDDQELLTMLTLLFRKNGYAVEALSSGEKMLAKAKEFQPELVILDIMLPDMDGMALCRQLRNEPDTASIPVIMLTAKGQEIDKVVGLEAGADDYMTKPFGIQELLARARAVLRRKTATAVSEVLTQGSIVLRKGEMTVKVDGKLVNATPKEFRLLAQLMGQPGKVFTRDELLKEVWGYDYGGYSRTVDVHIRRLREKLGSEGEQIVTVQGAGYKFQS